MTWHHQAEGVLLFIILGSAFTMSNALIGVKKLEEDKLKKEEEKIKKEKAQEKSKKWLKEEHEKQIQNLKGPKIESNDKLEDDDDVSTQQAD